MNDGDSAKNPFLTNPHANDKPLDENSSIVESAATTPTPEELAAAAAAAEVAKQDRRKSAIRLGIVTGVLVLLVAGVITALVIVMVNSRRDETPMVATAFTCLGIEFAERSGYSYRCDAGNLTVQNTQQTFGTNMRVLKANLEEIDDNMASLKAAWGNLGYSVGKVESKEYRQQRVLTMELGKGEVQELVAFMMLDKSNALVFEITDFAGTVNYALIETALALLDGASTADLKASDVIDLKTLSGKLTLLDKVAEMAQRDAQRKADVKTVGAAVLSYMENNKGRLPPEGDGAEILGKYVETKKFADPSGERYTLQIEMYSDEMKNKGAINSYGTSYAMRMVEYAKCSGGSVVGSDNSRRFAVLYRLENGATYCVDNS